MTFINNFHPYLLGKPFLLRTDHGSLVSLQNLAEGQLAQWLEKLQEYKFTIVHRSGRQHSNADALSKRACSQCQLLEPVTSAPHVNFKEEPVSPSTVTVAANDTVDGACSAENSLNIVSL